MQRRMSYALLTLVGDDGTRHILPSRNGSPLCGAERTESMQINPPVDRRARDLCEDCLQQFIRNARSVEEGGGW